MPVFLKYFLILTKLEPHVSYIKKRILFYAVYTKPTLYKGPWVYTRVYRFNILSYAKFGSLINKISQWAYYLQYVGTEVFLN